MILGLGSDICDIRRIEQSLERFGDRFIQRVFTPPIITPPRHCEERSDAATQSHTTHADRVHQRQSSQFLGLGSDTCDIRRIEQSLERFGDRFIQRVLTPPIITPPRHCEERSDAATQSHTTHADRVHQRQSFQ